MSYSTRSTVCYFDPNSKQPEQAFCFTCWNSLPRSHKDALAKAYGDQDDPEPDYPDEYRAAWRAAAYWLQAHKKRLQQFEEKPITAEEAY